MTPAPTTLGHGNPPTREVRVLTLRGGVASERPDQVVAEEPLEVRLAAGDQEPEPVAVTMRTPGNDLELAVGFLLSEGMVGDQRDVLDVQYCRLPPGDPQLYNVVTVTATAAADTRHRRTGTVTASCGICGTATLDDLRRRCPVVPSGCTIDAAVLTRLPDELRRHQRLFERTGGLHAAGLADPSGEMLAVREDIGRHNAVDKLIGWAALGCRLPLAETVLVVSGRVSFEIVQKAAVAGIPTVVAVSAPSSLAVETARQLGMTLAAFVRADRANVYSCDWRVIGRNLG